MDRPKVTPEMIAQAAQKLATDNDWDAEQAKGNDAMNQTPSIYRGVQ